MTMPYSRAEHELEKTLRLWETLTFKESASVGNLVFVYHKPEYRWIPCWVICEKDGLYEVETAHGNTRISGLTADRMGFAVDKCGAIIRR